MTDVKWFNLHRVAFLDTAHVATSQLRFRYSEHMKSANYEVTMSDPLSEI
jgi:hypothetical protein